MSKKKDFLFFTIALTIIILDQLTKQLVKNFTNLRIVMNPGSLWGLFPNTTNLLAWLSVIIVGVFLYNYEKIQKSDLKVKIGSSLIVGGAVGNLIDRVLYKSVIDFIRIGWWPSFNIADSAITIGVILLICYTLKEEIKN
jgi:signal peptidase II